MLTFLIPVKAKSTSCDWGLVLENLHHTLASIENQTSPAWRALVICQNELDLDVHKSAKIYFLKAIHPPAQQPLDKFNLTPMQRALLRRANDIDRVRKLRIGAEMLHQLKTDFVMNLEADDLVCKMLCEYTEAHKDANGWYFQDGYTWNGKSNYVNAIKGAFNTICGSSFIVKVDYALLPRKISLEVDASRLRLFDTGFPFLDHGHKKIPNIMEQMGRPMLPLPFPGSIYLVNHGESMSTQYCVNRRIPDHWNLLNRLTTGLSGRYRRYRTRLPLTSELRDGFAIGI